MARREVYALREPTSSGLEDLDAAIEQGSPTPDSAPSRPGAAKSKQIRALVGSSILQLPIWGFAMNYGVFQECNIDITGIIGTTSNGVMYLSMPFLFALFTKKWAHRRQLAALCGAALACLSFLVSSFSTNVWHLVLTQGVLAALGCAFIYSATTLSLGEWFTTSNRTVAYGATLSCKNLVGTTCPFLLRALLDRYGFRMALRIWMAIAAGTGVLGILLIPASPILSISQRSRKIPWHFLKHRTFHIYSAAILLQSSGYGIPQTYLSTFAHEIAKLSQTSATLLLTLFNVPGILSSSFFSYLCDNKRFSFAPGTTSSMSAISSALSAFFLWGLTSKGDMALLVLFSVIYGFFAGGYSGTWGGIINELEQEAAQANEAIDSGMVYGLLNGARGIGYVSGGLVSVPLLKAGTIGSSARFGYGITYGPLIMFTGFSTLFGALGLLSRRVRLTPSSRAHG
ncbi:MAG: hypothetical protein M1828_001441 [Chrysothrix sp. TS-e1954]|nr:MAG: hypothetical protein M1828_001441 [Chrysothrix sp. TS-e1954]